MYTYPSEWTSICRLYLCTMSEGKYLIVTFIYSGVDIGVCRNMSFKSILRNLAPCCASEMTLLNNILVSVRSVAGEPESKL